MRVEYWSLRWIAVASVIVMIAGCSNSPYEPVQGNVTLDGKPLEDATVVFVPEGEGEPASSTTKNDGRFELNTQDSRGAAPGDYVVLVTKIDHNVPKFKALNAYLTPKIYSNKATSPLKITLPSDKAIQFDLDSKLQK